MPRLTRPGARRPALFWAAVLIALAVGMVLGAGVLGRYFGDSTNTQLRGQVADLSTQREVLARRSADADAFATEVAPALLRAGLGGKGVLVVAAPDADPADVRAVASTISSAGGVVTGTVDLKSAIYDPGQTERLRGVVTGAAPSGVALDAALVDPAARAGDLLGAVLLTTGGSAPVVGAADVLASLRQGGFLQTNGDTTTAQTAVVVTGGRVADPDAAQGQAVGRLAAGLALHGAGAVLAGRTGSADGAGPIVVVRKDPQLSRRLATVSVVDTATGQAWTGWALVQALAGRYPGYGS
jgi:hypothetical protein